LTKDKNILTSILTDYDITFRDDKKSGRPAGKDDICIFTEIVDPRFYGKYNILIPNQEWFFTHWVKELKNFQAIWVKTKLAYNIFSTLHPNVKYIGFTSVDMYKEVEKVKECFHTRGKSSDKGTEFLTEWSGILPLNIISDQLNFPKANHIRTRLPDDKFLELANKCLIHICPSTMEGFGHYINEAKSMGNIVIATDSAPMNELVTDKRFLSKVINATTKATTLGTYTRTNINEIEKILNDVKDLDLIEIGKQNRIEFLKQDADFKERLKYELSKI
jgi:glycosyltransferase involved in cell wall biosynthesis